MTMEQYLRKGGEWKAGQMVLLTTGTWDAYAIEGLYRVSQCITAEVLEPYVAEPQNVQGGETFRDMYFAAWLTTHGYLEPIHYYEWNMGNGYYEGSIDVGRTCR